jgi:hypothetical protein
MYRSSTKEVLPEDDEEDFYYNDDRSDNEDEDEENAGYEDEEPIEDHNIDYTIYFHPEHFDGEINEFYRLICNKQTNETYVHQKLKQN